MKKITFLAAIAFAISFSSCKKEIMPSNDVANNENASSQGKKFKDYKYSKEIRVYNLEDNSFFVDIDVKSDHLEDFNAICAFYNSSKMQLIYESPKIPATTQPSYLGNSMAVKKNLDINGLGTLILYKQHFKGEAKGFRVLDKSDNSSKTSTLTHLSGSNMISFGMPSISYFSVFPQNFGGVYAEDYVWDGFKYIFYRAENCPYWTTTYISGLAGDHVATFYHGGSISIDVITY